MRKYEGMFIIKADLDEGGQEKTVDSIKKSISKHGGTLTHSEKWGNRQLAYTVKKYREGVYYRFEFEMKPESISVLRIDIGLNEDIIRELITAKEK